MKSVKQGNLNRIDRQQQYVDKYQKIIVTYKDGSKLTFTPDRWFIFENKIRPIAKNIKIIKNTKTKIIMKSVTKFMSELTGTENNIINGLLFALTVFAVICIVSFIGFSIVKGWK